jgi:hypothetical protein
MAVCITELQRENETVDGTQEHNHSPDLADCKTKIVFSSIKEIAASNIAIGDQAPSC